MSKKTVYVFNCILLIPKRYCTLTKGSLSFLTCKFKVVNTTEPLLKNYIILNI